VQVALLTRRIEDLQKHFKNHKKDNHSRTGLLQIVSDRKKLLSYLKKKNLSSYQKLVEDLKIRD
jgi:ribosomal protein S15, bacterial/organelle